MDYEGTTVMVPVMNPLVAMEYGSHGASQFQVNVPVSLKYAKKVTLAPALPSPAASTADGNGTLNPAYGPFSNEKVCTTNPAGMERTHGPSDVGVEFRYMQFPTVPLTVASSEGTGFCPVSKLMRVNSRSVCAGTLKLAGAYWSVLEFMAVSNGLLIVKMTPAVGVPEDDLVVGDGPRPTG
jgi:hypothetical protein